MLKSMLVQASFSTCILAVCVFLVGCPPSSPKGPTAEFRADVTSGAAPLTVRFTDLSTPGDSPIAQWVWLFGDGATSDEQDPAHTYAAAGKYHVSLTVTTATGEDTKLKLNLITVTAAGEGEGEGEGEVHSGEMVSVPAGTFTMGRTDSGDDATYGGELPRHQVTLSAYQIGKYDVTNHEYADMLNWALARGYLKNKGGEAYDSGDVYAANEPLLYASDPDCQIAYSGVQFSCKTRIGLPGTTSYSMALHPVIVVTWYGAAMYCNWLSASQGLTPCYDINDWTCNFAANGYHLPTEAQWERAAAWDVASEKHWIYGFMSDTLSGKNRCNYNLGTYRNPDHVNPLGLTYLPFTSPVGWFDGFNVSPNGNVATVNSPSPVGCYDMSGNVWQWCNDWYASYASAALTDPQGPSSGSFRRYRGGAWDSDGRYYCRSAARQSSRPENTRVDDDPPDYIGFRLAR